MLTSRSLKNTDNQTAPLSFQIRLNYVVMSQEACVKYLSVLSDSKLDWSSQVQLVRIKLSRASYYLKSDKSFLLQFSKSYNRVSFLFIYNTAWGTASNSVL